MPPRPDAGADWRPSASLDALRLRARMLARARSFFADRGLLEVETPMLSAGATVDPAIDSLTTHPQAASGKPRFLHTSPEFAMKRLLAAGSGDIWQLCRVFRDGESGRRHNPEFTLVEWYRNGWTLDRLIDETADFVAALLDSPAPPGPVRRVPFRDALAERLNGMDPLTAPPAALANALSDRGVAVPDGLSRNALLDLAMGVLAGPSLGLDGCPVAVVDYPATQAALARIVPGNPPVAARFELFVHGMELANGFHELADAAEQRTRFDRERAARAATGADVLPADVRLLAALEAGLPDCCGVAVGFDRLVMLAAGARDIGEVLAFDFARA